MSAQVRMADALLRSVGGRTVLLHIPAPAVQGDLGEQVGLGVPGFQDVALGPAVFRRVRPAIALAAAVKVAEYELLISASAVEKLVGSLAFGSAEVLFGQADGVLVDGALFSIVSATSSEAFGQVYLYRLGLHGAAAMVV